ncbi:MAG: undecaprenyl-diphosphate phosphatase [Actinobacteria bacterium]|jgi:undecaprenyl-diphosphatase|nr:undecaprenyl-diphosphate phosphatase [Actinomycetota bacterium]NCW34380.1 undecaprenyl-diphosphate phosphatase [Actinomycetota bacterium]NCZ73161.1 undecaprenyl-diphosphate phosphatase [Actinomycetota bacterium]NDA41021.1 undecaprenyl-diphosphate phosphatase [Actinomycetota bacterium]NDB30888.1 undecaprenyl-diphosphate phosphatase [Actinomycetota bacterium]
MGNFLEPIFLGLIQGLTEFLPISSSAHLRIAGEFFNTPVDPGATFTAITQIGTELAVLLYFRREILSILRSLLRYVTTRNLEPDGRLGLLIIVGTLPIVIFGFLGQETIRSTFRSLWLIATVLIVFGLILGAADRFGRSEKKIDQLNARDAILYGLAQSLALIPGVSRSGATIAMGRIMGYDRVTALRYSFLLALPAVFASGFFELYKAVNEATPTGGYSLVDTGIATVVAFVVGYLMIAWLLKFVSTKSFMPFVVYRVFLGSLVLFLLSQGMINA